MVDKIMAFCMMGGHSVEVPSVDELPEGWRLVKAKVIHAPSGPLDPWSPGIWYEDETSESTILACPDHQPVKI